jgi:hypothetical protein
MAIKFCCMDLIDLAVDNHNSTKRDCILWPAEFHPSQTPIHVRNELSMDVSPDLVWAWLIHAQVWPTWYGNSSHVRFLNQDSPDLQLGTTFRWSTFWVLLTSTVVEYIPGKRIAWSATGTGISAYHAWIVEPTEHGCYVLTEETQTGCLARLGMFLMPNRMYRYHQIWLEQLQSKASSGLPTI